MLRSAVWFGVFVMITIILSSFAHFNHYKFVNELYNRHNNIAFEVSYFLALDSGGEWMAQDLDKSKNVIKS